LRLKGQVSINDVITLPNIVKSTTRIEDKSYLWPKINALAEKAVKDLMAMRHREGLALLKDLKQRLHKINSGLSTVEKESPRIISKFRNKILGYLKGAGVPSDKIVEETGVFARSIDISEEIVRLKSHLNNFRSILNNNTAEKGRTLDFIAQEMQREINTIGSKSTSTVISNKVVIIKSEIEKIREQLSNVE
jgi:uncharacterized protein (TIGR00255 family)